MRRFFSSPSTTSNAAATIRICDGAGSLPGTCARVRLLLFLWLRVRLRSVGLQLDARIVVNFVSRLTFPLSVFFVCLVSLGCCTWTILCILIGFFILNGTGMLDYEKISSDHLSTFPTDEHRLYMRALARVLFDERVLFFHTKCYCSIIMKHKLIHLFIHPSFPSDSHAYCIVNVESDESCIVAFLILATATKLAISMKFLSQDN